MVEPLLYPTNENRQCAALARAEGEAFAVRAICARAGWHVLVRGLAERAAATAAWTVRAVGACAARDHKLAENRPTQTHWPARGPSRGIRCDPRGRLGEEPEECTCAMVCPCARRSGVPGRPGTPCGSGAGARGRAAPRSARAAHGQEAIRADACAGRPGQRRARDPRGAGLALIVALLPRAGRRPAPGCLGGDALRSDPMRLWPAGGTSFLRIVAGSRRPLGPAFQRQACVLLGQRGLRMR